LGLDWLLSSAFESNSCNSYYLIRNIINSDSDKVNKEQGDKIARKKFVSPAVVLVVQVILSGTSDTKWY
jgi:hypothetical protein